MRTFHHFNHFGGTNMKPTFQPDPTIESAETAWAGPVSIGYYRKQGLIQFEAVAVRGGKRHVVRSFTLRAKNLVESPDAIVLLQRALEEISNNRKVQSRETMKLSSRGCDG
jgi:hypothetical protein